MSRIDFIPDLVNKLMQFEKWDQDGSVGITIGYGVTDQLRLIVKELNHDTFGNQ